MASLMEGSQRDFIETLVDATPHIVVRAAGAVDAVPGMVRRVLVAADPELAPIETGNLARALEGPLPADGFFAHGMYRSFDGILAMYHDQGLIPLKTLHFDEGINVTLGLPIVRTSPDHGTAFDIAGRGVADPGAMVAAIRTAGECAARLAAAA